MLLRSAMQEYLLIGRVFAFALSSNLPVIPNFVDKQGSFKKANIDTGGAAVGTYT